jgi:hypothetical protein
MASQSPAGRLSLDIVFAILLLGLLLCATMAAARLAPPLASLQLLLWGGLPALGASSSFSPPDWMLVLPMLATGGYGVAATWLALHWFFSRRRRYAVQAADPPSATGVPLES